MLQMRCVCTMLVVGIHIARSGEECRSVPDSITRRNLDEKKNVVGRKAETVCPGAAINMIKDLPGLARPGCSIEP